MAFLIRSAALAAALVTGGVALASEDAATAPSSSAAATPSTTGQPTATEASGAQAAGPAEGAGEASKPISWRYRKFNGRWWYWSTSNRWLYWSEPQGWVAYQQPVVQPAAPRAATPDYSRWGWDPANPFNRYPPGRPRNDPKSFPKNM